MLYYYSTEKRFSGVTMEEVQYIRGLLWRAVEDAGGKAALAAQWGVSAQYVADVLNGRRDPGKSILKALGYERVVLYRKIGEQE
jgi:hypothetical protein